MDKEGRSTREGASSLVHHIISWSHPTLSRGPHTWLLPADLEEEVEVEVDLVVRKKVPEESLGVTVNEGNRCFAEYADHG